MLLLGLKLLVSLEKAFADSKALYFRGTLYVRLLQLNFPDPIRTIDEKLVVSLKRDFKAEGCL